MAVSTAFSGRASGHSICSKSVAGLALSALPLREACQLEHVDMNRLPWQICLKKRRATNKPYKDRGSRLVVSSMSNFNIRSSPLSPSDTIKQFYTYINEKNLKRLGNFISDDCFFEDFSFPKPFQGKKEVLHFFEELITCMGQNIEFNIGHVCEGDDFTAGVYWHLDWNKKQVPFTRGCSFYELSRGGERLVIKKAQVVIESPIKPGGLALSLLKIVTSLFDAFPEATEWFLKSPHVMLQRLLNIYNIVLWPFISPLLVWYITLWNSMARLLSFTLKILLHISKIFCQSSLLSRLLDHVSNNERTTNGPMTGGSGGGLLKASIGSALSFVICPPSPTS